MRGRRGAPSTLPRLFGVYAIVVLVPVLLVGAALATSYRHEAQDRGLAEARSEARLVAQTAVEPVLDGRSLDAKLSSTEVHQLQALVRHAVRSHDVLRLRLRNLQGNVVFSDDGSGFRQRPEDEALDAARGHVVARLTRFNSDPEDTGPIGPEVVEVYLPLHAGASSRLVGVLELYLPYAPINADVTAGLHRLYVDLSVGLFALYAALLGISWSVTRRLRQQLRENAHLAQFDTLTDLPNRTLFERLAAAALVDTSPSHPIALAVVDLDRFKEVNDTLGHRSGDELLEGVATRLAEALDQGDVVARLGGDEYGLLLRGTDHERELWRLRTLLEADLDVGGISVSVEGSIGYVVAPHDGQDVSDLLVRADVAMYAAKSRHAGVLRFEDAQLTFDASSLHLASELRQAIEHDELVLHYQPKVGIADRVPVGVEALVRWMHPQLGLLPPDRFIPIAEQTDLIDRLTAWVLCRALRESAGLGDSLTVSVNVSARNLGRPGLVELVAAELAAAGQPGSRLTIELTETALLADPDRAMRTLASLRALGVGVSVDDFGRGQTSLGYLSSLPVTELKIDREFVCDMGEHPAHAAIVRSMVELGHNLGFEVVAEGVETEDVLEVLREMGCDHAQGYLLARPMPRSGLGEWLARELSVSASAGNRLA